MYTPSAGFVKLTVLRNPGGLKDGLTAPPTAQCPYPICEGRPLAPPVPPSLFNRSVVDTSALRWQTTEGWTRPGANLCWPSWVNQKGRGLNGRHQDTSPAKRSLPGIRPDRDSGRGWEPIHHSRGGVGQPMPLRRVQNQALLRQFPQNQRFRCPHPGHLSLSLDAVRRVGHRTHHSATNCGPLTPWNDISF